MDAIEQLPARIDGLEVQILQPREEMDVEFSAVGREMAAADERVIEALSTRIVDARCEPESCTKTRSATSASSGRARGTVAES